MANAVQVVNKIVNLAENSLKPVERTMAAWPAEFQAIIWDAIADIAARRAVAAKIASQQHGRE